MRVEELKKAIRHLVKEEVKRTVAEEVSKAMGKVLVEMVKEIKSNNTVINERKNCVGDEVEYEPETPEVPIINTKNQKLNSVLNETARNFKPLRRTSDSSVGLAKLMDGGFDKIGGGETIGVTEPVTKMDFLKQMVSQSGPSNQPSALDGGAEVPDILKKVFKKDFRTIMKKIDEQKNGYSPGGYIDPSKVLSG